MPKKSNNSSIELTRYEVVNELIVTDKVKDKTYRSLEQLVHNPDISISDVIAALIDALNPKGGVGKILYAKSSNEASSSGKDTMRLIRVTEIFKICIETHLNQITELADIEKLYNSLKTIKDLKLDFFNNTIKELKEKIIINLTTTVDNHSVRLLDKITLCCDALNSQTSIGKILFHQRHFTAPSLFSGYLKSMVELIQKKIILQIDKGISTHDEKINLYKKLCEQLNGIMETEKTSYSDKEILYYLIDEINGYIEKYQIMLGLNALRMQKSPVSYAELLQHHNSLSNKNIIIDAQALSKKLSDHEKSISEKILACRNAIEGIIISNSLKLSDLIQIFSSIKIILIPQLNNCDDISVLKGELEFIEAKLPKDNTRCQDQFKSILNQLNIRYKLLSLLKANKPDNDKDIMSLCAACEGLVICWSYFFIHVNNEFASFKSDSYAQAAETKELKEKFFQLDEVIHNSVPQSFTARNAQQFFDKITLVLLDIIDCLNNNKNLPSLSENTKKIINALMYETTTIFDMRDVLYEKVAKINVPKLISVDNIIINEENNNNQDFQLDENSTVGYRLNK